MTEDLTFSSWLRQRRTALGVTRDELSERVGFSLDLLRKLESGERRPSGQVAYLLADYFRIPADEQEAFVTFARSGRAASSSSSHVAPWRNVHIRQTNLPALLAPLIGREMEEDAVRKYLLNPKTRLLTLTGAPGIGKTRLALQVASDLVAHFDDGVYFIDLSQTTDPELVLPTVAGTLGLKEAAKRSVEDVLFEFVHDKRALLVLDNFEQVLDAALQVVRLLEASPWLKVLATSREALHVRGERRYSVPPLALPDLTEAPGVEDMAGYPSVMLFMERAQAVAPDFALSGTNAEDVAAVCVGLEGLPLAIELAASRTRQQTPKEMRAGLGNRLGLLTRGARDLPARHRTLRAAIEWSFNLLEETEQRLFSRLGVFVGGFTPAAVQAICNDQSSDLSDLNVLLSLVDKNLVKLEKLSGEGSKLDQPRFEMLETIREYAQEQLSEAGNSEAEEIRRRHALFFMKLAEEAEPHLAGTEQVEWLDRLENENDNIRVALYWAAERSKSKVQGHTGSKGGSHKDEGAEAAKLGLRLAAALPRFWYKRGHLREGMELLRAALDAQYERWNAEPLQPGQAGAFSPVRPDSDPARPHVAKALLSASILAHLRGEYASARALCEESLAIRRELDDKGGVAAVLAQIGMLEGEQGNRTAARALTEQCLAIYREIDDRAGISRALNALAVEAYETGDHATSRSLLQESLAIWREIGDKRGIANILGNLGVLAWEEKDYASACALYEETLAIWGELGDEAGTAYVLGQLATIAYEKGDHPSAGALQRESLGIRWKLGSTIHIPNNLAGLGRLAATNEDPRQVYRGAQLLGTTSALWESMGVEPERAQRREYEDGIAACTVRLGEVVFTKAWNEGRDMSLEEAVDYALDTK